jgi:hypothetical protein
MLGSGGLLAADVLPGPSCRARARPGRDSFGAARAPSIGEHGATRAPGEAAGRTAALECRGMERDSCAASFNKFKTSGTLRCNDIVCDINNDTLALLNSSSKAGNLIQRMRYHIMLIFLEFYHVSVKHP